MEFVEQLKASVDIVKVVQEYVPRLRRSSASRFVGLCPFHNEKTPSFSVHAGHQFYKCFGCGAGGDVLKFVMEIERITFYEALRLLADRHGIRCPSARNTATRIPSCALRCSRCTNWQSNRFGATGSDNYEAGYRQTGA
jgi:DNA primase catalytic core